MNGFAVGLAAAPRKKYISNPKTLTGLMDGSPYSEAALFRGYGVDRGGGGRGGATI